MDTEWNVAAAHCVDCVYHHSLPISPMPWPNIHVVWKAQRCLVRINCWLHGSRFAAMKWCPNIQYHQHHRYHHDQSLKRLKMATALSESIVGVAINWRPAFHFSIHEMISPRGFPQYNPGNTAGCIRRYCHAYISIICAGNTCKYLTRGDFVAL